MKNFFKNLFKRARRVNFPASQRPQTHQFGALLRKKLPRNLRKMNFDVRKINIDTVSTHSVWFWWGIIIFMIFLASGITSRIVGTFFLRPIYTAIPIKRSSFNKSSNSLEDFSNIEQRNIFDVENKIPENFDPGFLDCLSQAKLSTQRITLLGTIVMGDEYLSVALIQEDGNPNKVAVRKDEPFFEGKFQAMKIDRKKLCFQVKQTQELEYIEIPDEGLDIAGGPSLGGRIGDGITPVSETKFDIKKDFLEKQLSDLNNVLQQAKAVPYMDNNKMKGFLIQSIDADSIFSSLGIRQGDVLTTVNDIVLDNMGKGVEAFQKLRYASKVELKVVRGGQDIPITYDVK